MRIRWTNCLLAATTFALSDSKVPGGSCTKGQTCTPDTILLQKKQHVEMKSFDESAEKDFVVKTSFEDSEGELELDAAEKKESQCNSCIKRCTRAGLVGCQTLCETNGKCDAPSLSMLEATSEKTLEKTYTDIQEEVCGRIRDQKPILSTSKAAKLVDFMDAYKAIDRITENWSGEALDLARELLTDSVVDDFLSLDDSSDTADGLDSLMVKCAVLTQATPTALANFASQGQDEEGVVTRLLNNVILMRDMLVAGGARGDQFGQAMSIYEELVMASDALGEEQYTAAPTNEWDDRSRTGILQRFALATALEHAIPIPYNFAKGEIDPVERYLHYEQAYIAGDLDPAFEVLTVFECRGVTNNEAQHDEIKWVRTTLPNYRPGMMVFDDYQERYTVDQSEFKTTKVKVEKSYKTIPVLGGKCGPRAQFSRFIRQSFGLPIWGLTQPKHAAVGVWTPDGWFTQKSKGDLTGDRSAAWRCSSYNERGGEDFFLETQCRQFTDAFRKVLRGQWLGLALGEDRTVPEYSSCEYKMKNKKGSPLWRQEKEFGTGGSWNALSRYLEKITILDAPAPLPPIPIDEPPQVETKVEQIIEKLSLPPPDPIISIAANGILIPAAAYRAVTKKKDHFSRTPSADIGEQIDVRKGAEFFYDINVVDPGTYFLTANITTWNYGMGLKLKKPKSKVPVFWTEGYWSETQPVEVTLEAGQQLLEFQCDSSSGRLVIKSFFLYKTKPTIPEPSV